MRQGHWFKAEATKGICEGTWGLQRRGWMLRAAVGETDKFLGLTEVWG